MFLVCIMYRVLIMSKGVRAGARGRIESSASAQVKWTLDFHLHLYVCLAVCLSTGVIHDNDRVLDNLLDRSTILGLVNSVLGHGSPSFLFLFFFPFASCLYV